jgi:hypothetical protein
VNSQGKGLRQQTRLKPLTMRLGSTPRPSFGLTIRA